MTLTHVANQIRLLALVLSSVMLMASAGCGAAPKRGTTLIEDVRGYNDGVRWNHHVLAAKRIHPKERDAFLSERTDLEDDLRIGDYQVVHVKTAGSTDRARVKVKYMWHLDSKGQVHQTTTMQKWRRYGKRWLMVGERRVRGETMPGVDEPETISEPDDADSEGAPDDDQSADPSNSP